MATREVANGPFVCAQDTQGRELLRCNNASLVSADGASHFAKMHCFRGGPEVVELQVGPGGGSKGNAGDGQHDNYECTAALTAHSGSLVSALFSACFV